MMWRSDTGPLTSGGLTNDATPALSGTAEAGATVTIYDGSTVRGHRGGG
ncbi:Ig-like domain-containing protein [Klebsiella pneumoniae subsp. pneumoniae]|nr:Ig-like domain-containing protein [Klebsiella pneumoniae subsp. pneumoniae]